MSEITILPFIRLNKNEQRVVLEALAAHAHEGWYLSGHYDSADGCIVGMQLGGQLCRTLGLDVKERSWIENEKGAE